MDQDSQDLIKGFDEATTAVATRIQKLLDNATNITELKAALAPELERLTALGSDPAEPIPAETPAQRKGSHR